MNEHSETKQKVALASIFASAALTLGKLVAGVLSGSLALISEALHSLLDTGATIITYYAVRASDKPADDEHHFGHGKIEAVAALAETGLLIALAVGVVVEAIRRLGGHAAEVNATWLTFAVLGVVIVVDFVRWRTMARVAKETKSDALASGALHFASDLVSSTLVVIGLIATLYGYPQADSLAAIGLALFIGVAGYKLGRKTIDTLTDVAPVGLATEVRTVVQAVPGVASVDSIRLRPSGAQVVGEVGITVPRTFPLDRVVRIKDEVGAAIARATPEVNVTVTANPRALDNETVLERVLLTAALRRLPVHHVTVQEIDGRISVGMDIELDARMSQGAAHAIASRLETALRDELGQEIEVDTHIEPLEVRELEGHNADDATLARIAQTLAAHAAEGGVLSDVHNVRARTTSAGLVVNYHCRVDPHLTVKQVHEAVDGLDRRLRNTMPGLARIVGHAEPLRPAA